MLFFPSLVYFPFPLHLHLPSLPCIAGLLTQNYSSLPRLCTKKSMYRFLLTSVCFFLLMFAFKKKKLFYYSLIRCINYLLWTMTNILLLKLVLFLYVFLLLYYLFYKLWYCLQHSLVSFYVLKKVVPKLVYKNFNWFYSLFFNVLQGAALLMPKNCFQYILSGIFLNLIAFLILSIKKNIMFYSSFPLYICKILSFLNFIFKAKVFIFFSFLSYNLPSMSGNIHHWIQSKYLCKRVYMLRFVPWNHKRILYLPPPPPTSPLFFHWHVTSNVSLFGLYGIQCKLIWCVLNVVSIFPPLSPPLSPSPLSLSTTLPSVAYFRKYSDI